MQNFVVPGVKIELQLLNKSLNNRKEEPKVYNSRVSDVISDDKISVSMPIEQSKLILLPINAEYNMVLFSKSGLYQCDIKVVDRYKENGLYFLVLEMLTDFKKYQRREFYRYSCDLNIEIRNLVEEEIKSSTEHEFFVDKSLPLIHGKMVDISGGGLRFLLDEQINKEKNIYCSFSLNINNQVKHYNLVGTIVRASEIFDSYSEFECCVKFLNIKNFEREQIIQYIFTEERKKRMLK